MAHRIFLAVFFLLPVLAAWGATVVDLRLLVPVVLAVTVASFHLHRQRLLRSIGPTRSSARSTRSGIRRLDPYAGVDRVVDRLRREAEDSLYDLIQSHMRLLELGEVWRARAQPDSLPAVLEEVVGYCQDEMGLREAAILRIRSSVEEVGGVWAYFASDGPRVRHVRWALRGLGGAVARALRTVAPVRAREGSARPLITINAEVPSVTRTPHASYLVVPIATPVPRSECLEDGWLYQPGCPAFQPQAEVPLHDRGGLDLSPCLGCRHFPIHGVLVVTDLQRREIDQRDELTLELLARTVASVLDRANLYQQVQAAERFRTRALDAMSNGLLTTDPHGRVVFANRSAQELLGDPAHLLGRPLDEILEIPSSTSPLHRTLVEGMEGLHLEGFLLRDAEEGPGKIPVRLNLAPFRSDQGGRFGAVCVFEDLTSIRAMEEEIRHLDTLAAVGRFASSLAHEIRNPLGGISAGITYLGQAAPLEAEHRESVAVIEGEINRLDLIIRNLLAVARPKELHLTAVSLEGTVERAVKTLRHWSQERKVRLTVRADPQLEPVYVDQDMVQQILVNLIKNAVEASPAGGTVEISLHPWRGSLAGELGASGPIGPGVQIAVSDEGAGIDPDDLPRIFEPFFSRKAEGTGLGLYVCHNFVQRHGGRLHATRSDRGGARFELTLPTFPARMGAKHETATPHRR